MPRWSNERPSDFFVATTDDPERAAELIVQICKERIPHKFGLNPITDVQVLSPMNRGSTGATALNGLLQ